MGFLAREHLVEHHPARVHVDAGIGGTGLLDLLGSEIGDGAEHGSGGAGHGVDGAHQPEVRDLDPPVIPYQHVLGLHVPVHEAGPVRRAERGQHGLQDVERGARLKRPALPQHITQSAPGDVLHGQIDVRPVGTLVEHLDDVGVGEPGDGLGLPDEPLDERRVGGERRVHHLEREHTVQAGVHGPVDRGHPADRDARLDAIPAVEQLPDQRVLKGRVHAGECTSRR